MTRRVLGLQHYIGGAGSSLRGLLDQAEIASAFEDAALDRHVKMQSQEPSESCGTSSLPGMPLPLPDPSPPEHTTGEDEQARS